MKIRNNAIIAGSVVLAGVVGLGSADVLGRGPRGMHGRHGRTGQSRLAPGERRARVLERHPEADTDGDGVLSAEEAAAFRQGLRKGAGLDAMRGPGADPMSGHGMRGPGADVERLLKNLDKFDSESAPQDIDLTRQADLDGDGSVSDEEWAAFVDKMRPKLLEHMAKRVPGADLDGNGTVSDAELEAFKVRYAAVQHAMMFLHHPEADTDGDGTLSNAEFETFHTARVAEQRAKILEKHPEADTDDDGVLSDEEARAFLRGLHEAHGLGDGPRHRRQGMHRRGDHDTGHRAHGRG